MSRRAGANLITIVILLLLLSRRAGANLLDDGNFVDLPHGRPRLLAAGRITVTILFVALLLQSRLLEAVRVRRALRVRACDEAAAGARYGGVPRAGTKVKGVHKVCTKAAAGARCGGAARLKYEV